MARDLIVLRGGDRLRWGGDLRRHYLFRALEEGSGSRVVAGFARADVRSAFAPYRRRRWEVWRRGPDVVSTELLDGSLLALVASVGRPIAIDLHDEPVMQAEALGIQLPTERIAEIRERMRANMDAFHRTVVPSGPFGRLSGVDPDRMIVAPNGTDSDAIRPAPWPADPAVAFISGAAPRRGIEDLVAAVRLVRGSVPSTRLLLYLAATGDDSRRYLDDLIARHRGDPWIEIGQVGYGDVGAALGRAIVVCIPTPAHPYWDSVAPIKLFDAMAAARPLVVTPRVEMQAVVTQEDAGVVSTGDGPDALAEAIRGLIEDPERARRLGEHGRRAAETRYDWRVISRRLAQELLGGR